MTTYTPAAPVTLTPAVPPLPKPERVLPPLGWRPMATDTPARIRHDTDASRFEGENVILRMTNETQRLWRYVNGAVEQRSSVVMKLAQRPAWVTRFISLMGEFVWSRFTRDGFGWMDFNAPNDTLTFNMLQCGGNLVNVMGKSGGYAILQAQDFYSPPRTEITPIWQPHLFVKQTLITPNLRVIVDRTGVGDLYIPLVSPVQPAIELADLEFYPAVPFAAKLDGWPVTVEQLCFAGSNTYGYIKTGLPEGWYLLEEMLIIGNIDDIMLGGTNDDRRTYCDVLERMPCPPPVIGWLWTG